MRVNLGIKVFNREGGGKKQATRGGEGRERGQQESAIGEREGAAIGKTEKRGEREQREG